MTKNALIVGGGIGGLCAAIALRRIDWDVTILEQSAAFGEIGAGLQLSPNAMHVLRAWDMEQAISDVAFAPTAAKICDGTSGRAIFETPLSDFTNRYGAPYFNIHRADFHRILCEEAKRCGVELINNACVEGYEQTPSQAIALLSNGEKITGDLLIGADGIRSKIAGQMHPTQSATFTGQAAWRATIKIKNFDVPPIPKNTYVWIGPHRHLVAYYIRNGTLLNVVACGEKKSWAEESWSQLGNVTDFRKEFSGWNETIQHILSACDQCHYWGLFARRRLPHWHDGRVVLLGDSCHAMLPYMAQGAAMAIEDAYVLADTIQRRSTDLYDALAHYFHQRSERTHRLQKISAANAKLYHAANPIRRIAAKTALRASTVFPYFSNKRLDSVYGFNVTRP